MAERIQAARLGKSVGKKLSKIAREGKRCLGVIQEAKRIKNMYSSGGMSMNEIREAWPGYEVWRIVEQLEKDDRAVFEKPLRWGKPVGYTKLILGKIYGKSPATISDWVKAYRKHERAEKQQN